MAREAFEAWKLQADTRDTLDAALDVLAEYEQPMSVREVFYRLVARGHIVNTKSQYERVGRILKRARLSGRLDWDLIVDRGRRVQEVYADQDPQTTLQEAADYYDENPWLLQDNYVEVWVEKDAQLGNIENVCERWRVPFMSTRGDSSSTAVYKAAKRLARLANAGKHCIILHLSDHDPSGLNMTTDLAQRVREFSRAGVNPDTIAGQMVLDGEVGILGLLGPAPYNIELRRIALTLEQVEEYDLPPNRIDPEKHSKQNEKIWDDYEARYGTTDTWEMDALEPGIIDDLIYAAVARYVDLDSWRLAQAKEDRNKAKLQALAELPMKEWPKPKRRDPDEVLRLPAPRPREEGETTPEPRGPRTKRVPLKPSKRRR